VGPVENEVVWRVLCGGIQNGLPVDAPLDEGVEPMLWNYGTARS
jgi:hypothetical protein